MSALLLACGAAVLAAAAALSLRRMSGDAAALVGAGGGIAIAVFLLREYLPQLESIGGLISGSAFSPYAATLAKALGIGFISEFSADVCRDLGESSLAARAELAGKIGIVLLCLPLVTDIIALAAGS